MQDGEPLESPFRLPVYLQCDACGREESILADPGLATPAGGNGFDPSRAPREAYRCRACRRACVDLVVGLDGFEFRSGVDGADRISDAGPDAKAAGAPARGAAEVVARCQACRRDARLAWADARPSVQELRLDALYGRR